MLRRHRHEFLDDRTPDGSTEDNEFCADVEAEWELAEMAVAHWERDIGWPQRAARGTRSRGGG